MFRGKWLAIVSLAMFAVLALLGPGRASAQDAVLATPDVGEPEAALATVTIVVVNQSGSPVGNASIALSRGSDWAEIGTTGVEGTYVFSGLEPGTYSGYVTADGYGQGDIASFDLASGDLIRIDVTLPPPPPGAIQFTITDESGAAIPGAGINLYDTNNNQFYAGKTSDSAGMALFGGLKASSYYAIVDANGYDRNIADNIHVEYGSTTDVTIKLGKTPPATTGTISVNVFVGNHYPVRNAPITLYGKTYEERSTGEIGFTVFGNVEPGIYTIQVDSEFGIRTLGPIEITAGQDLNLVIDYSQPPQGNNGTVIFQTYTDENYPHPLANVQVTLTGTDTTYSQRMVSDGEGTLVFRDVPPGDYEFEALALDANNNPYDGRTGNFGVDPGSTVVEWMRFRVSPAPGTASLAVTVTDEHDQPIRNAAVSVEGPLGTVSLVTGSWGIAFATELPPSDLTVRASAEGYADSDPVTVTTQIGKVALVTIHLSPAQEPPTPEPTPTEQPGGVVVTKLPSTGGGPGVPESPTMIALLLAFVAVIAVVSSAWLKRR
jgi:hypothetical protein